MVKNIMVAGCPSFCVNADEIWLRTNRILWLWPRWIQRNHEFIIKWLNAGFNVISEKPMTTDDSKCQAILEQSESLESGLYSYVYYRYPHLPKALMNAYDRPKSGHWLSRFHWYLDTSQGVDYFPRMAWRSGEGGTLCPKSIQNTNFDTQLVDWLWSMRRFCAYG